MGEQRRTELEGNETERKKPCQSCSGVAARRTAVRHRSLRHSLVSLVPFVVKVRCPSGESQKNAKEQDGGQSRTELKGNETERTKPV